MGEAPIEIDQQKKYFLIQKFKEHVLTDVKSPFSDELISDRHSTFYPLTPEIKVKTISIN